MYNYRIGNITDYDILEQVYDFCSDTHNEDELLNHVRKTLNALFALHECSLFHAPENLDDFFWMQILGAYKNCMEKSNILFPVRPVVGPQYNHYTSSDAVVNIDKRLTKLLPYFFGISYTTAEERHNNWKLARNPSNILIEHRKLYDILFSYCYPNGNLRYDEKEENNILGNFAKPSIFRFDSIAAGSYRKIIEHIHSELIYRISGSNSWGRLFAAMEVEQFASQMRSLAFSLIEQLMKLDSDMNYPVEGRTTVKTLDKKRCGDLYDKIIKRCKDIDVISIKETGKKDKYVIPINMDINDDSDAVMYYAYAFFRNLQTSDYIQEMQKHLEKNCDVLDKILDLSSHYKANRMDRSYWESVDMEEYPYIPYKCVEQFVEKAWNGIIPIVCIDDFESGKGAAFCKRHREHMIGFLHLFQLINHKMDEEYISVIDLIDLLHLYVRLKVCRVSIPTSSNGYIKTNPTKPVKVDSAMKLLQEEWDLRAENKPVPDELYMKNVIIETWLSAVMYMTIKGLDCSLFLKRMDATQSLFHALLQLVPSITKKDDKDVDYETIIHDLLDFSKNTDEHIR